MTYAYIVLRPSGKEAKGTIEAASYGEAAQQLKTGGTTLISLEEANALSREVELSFIKKKPKPRDMAVFCRQFVSIIDAGVPVTSALEMLGEQTENKLLAAAIRDCKVEIEKRLRTGGCHAGAQGRVLRPVHHAGGGRRGLRQSGYLLFPYGHPI